jgi:DNA-binding NarL/FixJ family response regulator
VDRDQASPAAPFRAIVAHPTAAGRLALRMVFENESGWDVAADTDDAPDAGRLAHELRAVLLVVHEALLRHAHLGPLHPETSLVVLGMELHPGAAAAARHHGAAAYVPWDRADEELGATLRRLAAQAVSIRDA